MSSQSRVPALRRPAPSALGASRPKSVVVEEKDKRLGPSGQTGSSANDFTHSDQTPAPVSKIAIARSKDAISSKDNSTMQPPSRITRAQSLRRPDQDGMPRSSDTPSGINNVHQPSSIKRTTSTIVKEHRRPDAAASNFGLQRSGSVRVPASSSAADAKGIRSLNAPIARVAVHNRTNSVNGPAGEVGLGRSDSIAKRHTRSQSSGLSTSSRLTAAKSSTDSLETSLERPTSKQPSNASVPRREPLANTAGLAAPSIRPAFNTLQQHYSPAKTSLPKPPVPSSRTTILGEDKVTSTGSSFEITKLQSELVYLSLLHQAAGTTLRSYEKSARDALSGEFGKLQIQYKQVKSEEHSLQEQVNLMSLADWSRISGSKGIHLGPEFAENVQRLSGALTDMAAFTAKEGRYSELVQTFSTWIAEAHATAQARETSPFQKNDLFVGPLSLGWHESHASFAQKLRLLEREVEMLAPLPSAQGQGDGPNPALGLMFNSLRSLTAGIKEELDMMERLEKQTLEKEKLWVEEVIAGLSLDSFQEKYDTPRTAWRTGA